MHKKGGTERGGGSSETKRATNERAQSGRNRNERPSKRPNEKRTSAKRAKQKGTSERTKKERAKQKRSGVKAWEWKHARTQTERNGNERAWKRASEKRICPEGNPRKKKPCHEARKKESEGANAQKATREKEWDREVNLKIERKPVGANEKKRASNLKANLESERLRGKPRDQDQKKKDLTLGIQKNWERERTE